jgi:hypothetical protein
MAAGVADGPGVDGPGADGLAVPAFGVEVSTAPPTSDGAASVGAADGLSVGEPGGLAQPDNAITNTSAANGTERRRRSIMAT